MCRGRLVKGFWESESVGITDHSGQPNGEAEAILGQLESNIIDKRSEALKRPMSLGKRILCSPEFGAEYEGTVRNNMAYAEHLTPYERSTNHVQYMPHSAVLSGSRTTQLPV